MPPVDDDSRAGHPPLVPSAAMTLEQNAADLVGHVRDFARRVGFTYSVVDPGSGEVVGCVYLYPPRRPPFDVDVRSWVCHGRAELDGPLHARC